MFASRSAGAGLPLLLKAAKRLEPLDAGLARETYRDALYAAFTAGRLPDGAQLADVAAAALAAPPGPLPERNDLLMNGVAAMVTEGYAAGVPMVRRALDAFRTEGVSRRRASAGSRSPPAWPTTSGTSTAGRRSRPSWSSSRARRVPCRSCRPPCCCSCRTGPTRASSPSRNRSSPRR
ncbi:hypothetical protein ACFQ0B_37115 [Nonomuraea thailandensis]